MSKSMTQPHESKHPLIACAMADDYPWDLIRERQLPDVEFEVWPECLDWDEGELLRRLRGVAAIVTGRKSPHLPDGLIDDRGLLRAVIHCHGGIRQLAREEHLRAGITVTNWGKGGGGGFGAFALMLNCLLQLPSLHAYAMTDKQIDGRIHQN